MERHRGGRLLARIDGFSLIRKPVNGKVESGWLSDEFSSSMIKKDRCLICDSTSIAFVGRRFGILQLQVKRCGLNRVLASGILPLYFAETSP